MRVFSLFCKTPVGLNHVSPILSQAAASAAEEALVAAKHAKVHAPAALAAAELAMELDEKVKKV